MKIGLIPSYPKNLIYGGQHVQQDETSRSLCNLFDVEISTVEYDCKEQSFDIYHLYGNVPGLSYITEYLDAPLIVSAIHGIRNDNILKKNLKLMVSSVAGKFGESTTFGHLKNLFSSAAAVVALTDTSKDFIISRYSLDPNKVHIIPNGVRNDFFKYSKKQQLDDHILISGNISSRKNQLRVVEFAMSKYGLNYQFHFIGGADPTDRSYFKRFLKICNAADNCFYHGYLSQDSDEYLDLFSKASGMLLFSKEETQSLSALEAIAAGKFLVQYDAAYSRERFMNCWPASKLKNDKEIHDCISVAQAISLTGEYEIPLSWDAVARDLYDLYKKVLN